MANWRKIGIGTGLTGLAFIAFAHVHEVDHEISGPAIIGMQGCTSISECEEGQEWQHIAKINGTILDISDVDGSQQMLDDYFNLYAEGERPQYRAVIRNNLWNKMLDNASSQWPYKKPLEFNKIQ